MTHNKPFLFVALLAAFTLSSCSGLKSGGCTTNCGGGTGSLSVTLVSGNVPAQPSLVAYSVVITGMSLTSASGPQSVNFTTPLTVDLMHLQSDSAFLGTFANIPAAQYTGISVSVSSASVTFFNNTSSAITNAATACASLTFCSAVGAAAVPAATFNFQVSNNTVTGLSLDINLANTVSLTATSFVTLNAANVATAFTLPQSGGNLSSSQFALIEDFSGVVTLNGNIATIVSPIRGTLTATATSNTIFDQDPSQTLCTTPVAGTLSSCVSNNQVVSADAILKSDGTLSIQEIEPLYSAPQDIVEGVVAFLPNSPSQFGIIVTDVPSIAVSNSLIGNSLSIGDALTVNLSAVNPFEVDNKGLPVSSFNAYSFFHGQTNTGALHFGQVVDVHVTSFTAATGSTDATANGTNVVLRWSRLTANASTQGSTGIVNINGIPSNFGFAPSAAFVVQLFQGTQGAPGVTNFDGVTSGTGVNASQPVSIRALFFEDAANSANPAFFAAKVRVP